MRSRVRPAGCLCELPGSGEPDLDLFELAYACPGVRHAGGGCVMFGARSLAMCRIRAVPVRRADFSDLWGSS